MQPVFFTVDQDDPRAPTQEEWDRMTAAERRAVVANLPSEMPLALPEGDRHRVPKDKARESLSEYYRRIGRRVYLSSELPVYYPGERMFAPDLIAVLDVEAHERDKWLVSTEGKGIDLALEITLSGDRRKDLEDNVERYARLGIPEYFVFDAQNQRLVAYRLDRPGGDTYQRIVPQGGCWPSQVLGLDLTVQRRRIRFYHGSAPLLEADELISQLTGMVDDLVSRAEEAEQRAEQEKQRAEEAEQRAEQEKQRAEEAEQRAERLAVRLRELGEEDLGE